MEYDTILSKFRLAIALEDYNKALNFLEKIVESIKLVSFDEMELLRTLKKGMMKKLLRFAVGIKKAHEEESQKSYRPLIANVLESYTIMIYTECHEMVDKFIYCIKGLVPKTKNYSILAYFYKMIGSFYSFLYEICEEKSKFLELALSYYQIAIEICLKTIEKNDIIKYRVFYSYCKFAYYKVNDKYRSMLFCQNTLSEIEKCEIIEKSYIIIKEKLERFFSKNRVEYSKAARLFYPNIDKYEYKN
jgi:hypothetical protein